jgi:hypothetical protein
VEIVIIDSRVRGFPGLHAFLAGLLDEVVVVFRAGARAALLSISPVIAFKPICADGAAVCYIPQS